MKKATSTTKRRKIISKVRAAINFGGEKIIIENDIEEEINQLEDKETVSRELLADNLKIVGGILLNLKEEGNILSRRVEYEETADHVEADTLSGALEKLSRKKKT